MPKRSAVRWRRLWSQPLVSSTPPRSVNRWVIGFSLIQILLALSLRRRLAGAGAGAGRCHGSVQPQREESAGAVAQDHPVPFDLVHRHLVDPLAGADQLAVDHRHRAAVGPGDAGELYKE